MQMDEVLCEVSEDVKNFAIIYLVDVTEVPDFNTMYELYDPCTVMFFFRNKHIMWVKLWNDVFSKCVFEIFVGLILELEITIKSTGL